MRLIKIAKTDTGPVSPSVPARDQTTMPNRTDQPLRATEVDPEGGIAAANTTFNPHDIDR